MQGATESAVAAIKSIDTTIGRMSQIATSIASAIEEQGVTTSEITRNTQQAAHGTHEVSRTIAEVNHAAGNTGSAAGQVLSSATALGGQADTLRREITRFLEEIQAA